MSDPAAVELTEPWDTPCDAVATYRQQIANRDLWTWRMRPDRVSAPAAAVHAAIRDGWPLSLDKAAAITGVRPPPLGTYR